MLTRRTFAGALACGLAAAELPGIALVVGAPGAAAPEGACVFTRAYAACPDAALGAKALLSGRFPHARDLAPRLNLVADAPVAVFVSAPSEDSPYDRAAHVALAIRHSKLPRGKVFDFPVSTVDVAPTLLALSGVEQPVGLHGRDLSPLLITGTGVRPESIFVEGQLGAAAEWRMVVRGFDKLVVRKNLDILHLFNLGDDPGEERDLAREIGFQLKVDELRALVRVWMKRTGDGMDPSGLKRRGAG